MRLYLFNPYFEVSPSSDYLFDFSPHGLNPIVKASEKSRFHSFIHSVSVYSDPAVHQELFSTEQ